MKLLRSHSIRQKLTRIIVLVCGVAILLACAAFAAYDAVTYRRTLASDLTTVAEITGSNSSAALMFGDADSAREILRSLHAEKEIVEACLYRNDGTVLAKYLRQDRQESFTPPSPKPEGTWFVPGGVITFRPIRMDGEVQGTIYVKSDLGELRAREVRFSGIIFGVILLSVFVAYLLATRLQRTISEPILELARTAFSVSTGRDYSLRAIKKTQDEIGFLFDRFNEMLDQIQERDIALKRTHDKLEFRVEQRTAELQKEVAERRQAERALEERTTFLNALNEVSPLAIVALDTDYRVQMCNPAFEKLFQYSRKEIFGRPLASLLGKGESAEETQSAMRTVLQGKSLHAIARRSRRDGTLVDVDLHSVPLAVTGRMFGVLSIYQDITERKRQEEALKRSEEQFRQIAENIREVFFVSTPRPLRVTYLSPAYEIIWGRPSAEVYERPDAWIESIHPEDRGAARAMFESCMKGIPADLEYRIIRPDGALRWIRNRTFPVSDDYGEFYRVVGTAEDISDRKQAEETLRESEERFRLAMEEGPLGMCLLAKDFGLLKVNRALCEMLGYSEAELLRRNLLELSHPSDVPEIVRRAKRHFQAESPSDKLETRQLTKDGRILWVGLSVAAVRDRTGQILYGLALAENITDRKNAEVAMRQAKEAAEDASKAKSEFLANMSHEIRTPMNGILGMTELALDTHLNPEQREYLRMVKSSAESLLSLLNDILDFSKIEAGKLDLDPHEFALRESLAETLKALGFRAQQKGLELAWRVAGDVPDRLIGDVGRLRQMLVNLVGNAIKFTERGEVVVEVEKEADGGDGVMLHFKVRDTGIGVAKEKQQMIFDAFNQADSSTTRKYGGTGLGLTISTRLAELMGGKIWVESQPGEGSTFHFLARFEFNRAQIDALGSPDVQILQDARVLVVDDNKTNRIILAEMLTTWGILPTLTEGANEALEVLFRAPQDAPWFQAIISDIHMPETDGFGLLEKIRALPNLRDLPVILLSSGTSSRDRVRCGELGVSAFLMKPINPSELLDCLLKCLSREPDSVKSQEASVPLPGGSIMKVLLAEDNAVNRALASKLLQKRGHTVVPAENGREALEVLSRESVDLVLMDMQMPEMDGFEAIQLIREQEKTTGGHLPIIALTAHAMKGDRERCLEAGADDYLSKPLQIAAFFAALDRARNPEKQVSLPEGGGAELVESGAVDWAAALNRVDGDRDLLEEIVHLFAEECPKLMTKLRSALEASDAPSLERLAHSLKGSASNLCASTVAASALQLEQIVRGADFVSAAAEFKNLENHVRALISELESFSGKVTR